MAKFPSKFGFDPDVKNLRDPGRRPGNKVSISDEAMIGAFRNPALNTMTSNSEFVTIDAAGRGAVMATVGAGAGNDALGSRKIGAGGRGAVMATVGAGAGNDALRNRPGGGRMDTINAGRNNDTLNPYFRGNIMDTIYAGWGNDTLSPSPFRSRATTIYAGSAMETVFAGGGNDTLVGLPGSRVYGAAGKGAGRVVTATVINPATRRAMSVTYDREMNKYLDTKLDRWINAPGWMRLQFR